MKIGHVNNYFRGLHRYLGGAENALYRTALIAREQGCDVFVCVLRPDLPNPACDFRYHRLRRWEDYMPRLMARYAEPVKWYSWQHDTLASRDFAGILRSERPDVVHMHNMQYPGLDLIRVAKEAGVKVVYTVYDYWMFCPNVMLLTANDEYCRRFHGTHCLDCLPDVLRLPQRILLARRKRVFDKYLALVDRWVALSKHSARIIEAYGIPPEKIRIIRLTLPLEYSALRPDDRTKVDPNVIFFAGWLQKRKGVHVLLQAMPIILKQCPNAQLRIAGHRTKFDWDYKKLIENLMRQPGLREHVTFLEHIPPAQVEQELRRCAVVAIPEQFENMSPLLMIEAMTLQKPVVISRVGGIPEFVEDGVSGWLADPRRPEEFAAKIIAVLRGDVEPRAVGQRARQRVQDLCRYDEIMRATMDAYRF